MRLSSAKKTEIRPSSTRPFGLARAERSREAATRPRGVATPAEDSGRPPLRRPPACVGSFQAGRTPAGRRHPMRVESSITSVSWIPSEAIKGMTKMPSEVGGVAHYDKPLPDVIDVNDLEKMRDNDQFRFANHLKAWIRVENDRIIDFGQ